MKHVRARNVDVDEHAPIRTWPIAAIESMLERGDLADYRLLAREIRDAPWGPVARAVEQVLGWSRPYGVSELMRAVTQRARAAADDIDDAYVRDTLRAAVKTSGLSQAKFARELGTSAPRFSSYLNGHVMPSARVLARAERVAAQASARRERRS